MKWTVQKWPYGWDGAKRTKLIKSQSTCILHVAVVKHGKMCVNESQLVLVLLLIHLEKSGVGFFKPIV